MNRTLSVLVCLVLASLCAAQDNAKPSPPQSQVPVIDGGAGPCSLELTIHDIDAKPVYAAKIKVHIDYGFGGFHKLDLEAATNADGKLKFTGLPARVRRPPLEFHVSKANLEGLATYDPGSECDAKRGITITPRKENDQEHP